MVDSSVTSLQGLKWDVALLRHTEEYKMYPGDNEEAIQVLEAGLWQSHASSQMEDGSGAEQEWRKPLELKVIG